MTCRLYDAHNHLQDDRFGRQQAALMTTCRQVGIVRMVVNGACEVDWPAVLALARQYPEVLPSFGCHPWYVEQRTAGWLAVLRRSLDAVPSAVGEIGLDRWKPDLPYDSQEAVFIAQLRLAAERNLPVSVHCLLAWGRLLEILQQEPRPACGFLLHSYGGPREMVSRFAELGGYFSLPGYFAHSRKERQREVFRHVPRERLLLETDAPDQILPPARARFYCPAPSAGPALNHPANLSAVYEFAAELYAEPMATLAARVEENFQRLFGGISGPSRAALPSLLARH